MRGKIVLLMGPPATGKSSLARDIVNWYRAVNPEPRLIYMATDGLRDWLCGKEYLSSLRPVAYRGLRVMAESVVVRGHHVLLDGNYLETRLRQPIFNLAKRLQVPILRVMTYCPELLSLRRNGSRNPKERVPDKVVRRAYRLAEEARCDADRIVDTSLGDPNAAREVAEWLLGASLDSASLRDSGFRGEWNALGTVIELKAGQVLWNAGEEAQGVALLLEGSLEVLSQQAGLPDMVIATVSSGELLGELSTVDGQPHSATLRALDDCSLSLVSKRDFHDLLRRYPGLLENLLRGLAHRVRALSCSVGKAGVDVLTGLANRRLYEEVWPGLVRQAQQSAQPLSLVLFDIDCFKSINDSHGHEAGDFVLRRLADVVRHYFLDEATCIRLGGDEFLILLPATCGERALQRMQGLAGKILATDFCFQDGVQLRPTLSVGIATLPKPVADPEKLFLYADEAAYCSKRNGRNQITSWTPDLNQT